MKESDELEMEDMDLCKRGIREPELHELSELRVVELGVEGTTRALERGRGEPRT